MASVEVLRQTVAEFFQVEKDEVTASFRLTGPRIRTSLARYALDAAIRRRVGVRCKSIHAANTFGDLAADIGGDAQQESPEIENPSPALGGRVPGTVGSETGLACGIDIQSIAELPAAADHWEHEFYQATFSPAEIAYCLAQQQPAQHFAGHWCAKEALKKAEPAFLDRDMHRFQVSHDESGAPFLQWSNENGERIPVSLSISHTDDFAVAVVACTQQPAIQTQILPGPPPKASPQADSLLPQDDADSQSINAEASHRRVLKLVKLAVLISLLGVTLGAAALARASWW